MRHDLPSGTVIFLFTDVEGSTKLLHSLGAEAYAKALAEHRRVVGDACAANGGVEVDTQGDAFFFAFPTASGAVAATGEMTGALAPGRVQVRSDCTRARRSSQRRAMWVTKSTARRESLPPATAQDVRIVS
jgi:class 3 adenylate cyclase